MSEVAIVTGAGSGIGRSLASRLGAAGSYVFCADRDVDTALQTAAAISAGGGAAEAVATDVTDTTSIENLRDAAFTKGTVTTVCLNAGVVMTGPPLWETTEEALQFVFDVNTMGFVRCARIVLPALIGQEDASRVLVTGSMAGLLASPNSAAYSASKAAVVAFCRALHAELGAAAPHVSLSLLSPGMVQTNLMLTSTNSQPKGAMTADAAAAGHDALNSMGLAADDVAAAALAGATAGEFWLLPPVNDMFTAMWRADLAQLGALVD